MQPCLVGNYAVFHYAALLYFLPEQDPLWQNWRSWTSFCASGYIAALYYRARGLEVAGLAGNAAENLNLALKMFGPCGELDDFMGPSIWRLTASDIELNLMRLRGRWDASLASVAVRGLVEHGLISAYLF